MKEYLLDQPVKWYKDNKLMIGVVIVVISFVLGFYGKVLILSKLYQPVELMTGISVYAFSWILLLIGAFIIGWRAVKRIHYKIHHHVKRTVKKTYHHAKRLPRKASSYTKKLHKKSMNRLQKTSEMIAKKYQ